MKLVSVRCNVCREVGGFGPSASKIRFDLRSRLGWACRRGADLCPDCMHDYRFTRDDELVRRPEALAGDKALS